MKKIFTITTVILILINIISCNNETNSENKKNYSNKNPTEIRNINIIFKPAFFPTTSFTINIEEGVFVLNKSNSIVYERQVINDTTSVYIADTLLDDFKQTYNISEQQVDFLINKINKIHNGTIKEEKEVFDGIEYQIHRIDTKNDTISLISNKTIRNDENKSEYDLLDAVLNICYNSIKNDTALTIIENIYDYFDYFPIRKISNNPLEFKIWGHISGCRNDNKEFIQFLNNLPNNKPIIFDLKNGGIAPCLDEVLIEYLEKKDIYIYGFSRIFENEERIKSNIKEATNKDSSFSSLLKFSLYKSEIEMSNNWKNNKTKIFSNRKEVINTIANNK